VFAFLDGTTAISSAQDDPLELRVGAEWRLTNVVKLTGAVTKGLSDGSADWGSQRDSRSASESRRPDRLHPADVAAVVRRKIAAGILPMAVPERTRAGPGTGRTCDACDLEITPAEVEHEVDLRNGRTLRVHQLCLTVWTRRRCGGSWEHKAE
jgi:hypothetical protein